MDEKVDVILRAANVEEAARLLGYGTQELITALNLNGAERESGVHECEPGAGARSDLLDIYEDLVNLAEELDVAWLATHSEALQPEQHLGGILSRLGSRATDLAERLLRAKNKLSIETVVAS